MNKLYFYIIKILLLLLFTILFIVFGVFRLNNKHYNNIY